MCDVLQNEIIIGGMNIVQPHCYVGGLVKWQVDVMQAVNYFICLVLLRE